VIAPATRPALSGQQSADVCVLGGGMTGGAAALELARRGQRVILLEAGALGSGASGRNLGHIATGLGSHYTAAIQDFGRDGARAIWETHRENHARLKELLAQMDDDCGYDPRGGFQVALDRDEARELADSEDLLRDDGFAGEFLDHYMLETRFAVAGFTGGYWSADDATIDSLAFVQALGRAAERAGAVIYESTRVDTLETSASGAVVRSAGGEVQAPVVLVALNAFAGPLVPFLAERIRPLRGQCVAIAHDHGISVPSPAYAEYGRVYWRQTPPALLVGGFDDLDLAAESTAELGTTPLIQNAIVDFAKKHLHAADAPVVASWSGIMGISLDGFPFIGPIPDTPLVCAAGFTGLGFGYAMLAAHWACEWIVSGHDKTPQRYRAAREFHAQAWPPWNKA
jgi:glycine/D-amino acid oxidase-like deaminating enzyme